MKNIHIITLLLFFLPIIVFGQSKYNYKQGYGFIRKAERKLNNGHLAKAEKFLVKARISNYGFCGNAWATAFSKINLLQAQIYIRNGAFDKALVLLDSMESCMFGEDCNARDSLKISTLILKYGKEKVAESFKKVTKTTVSEDYMQRYSIYLPDLEYVFRFECYECDNYYYAIGDGKSNSENNLINELFDELLDKRLKAIKNMYFSF